MTITELINSLSESFPDLKPLYVLAGSQIVKGVHGVYVVYTEKTILYIGKAGGLKNHTEYIKADICERVGNPHKALKTKKHKIKDLLNGGCEKRTGKLMYIDTWSKDYSPTYIEHFLLQQHYTKEHEIPEFNNSF